MSGTLALSHRPPGSARAWSGPLPPLTAAPLVRHVSPAKAAGGLLVPPWWPALHARTRSRAACLSAGWIESWLAQFGRAFRATWLHWESGGEVVGGCLLLSHHRRAGPFPLATWYLNATGEPGTRTPLAEYNDVLHVPGHDAAIVQDLARFLAGERWSRLVLAGIADGALAARLPALLPAAGREVDLRPAPRKRLDGRIDAADAARGNEGRLIRRALAAYAVRSGPVDLRPAASVGEALTMFEGLVQLSNARWAGKGIPGSFQYPAVVAFHRDLIAARWGAGIELAQVRAGSETLGFLYNFIEGRAVRFYQGGFVRETDPAMKPGLAAHAAAIAHYAARGFHEYDFMAGDARYKRAFATDAPALAWTTVYRDTPAMRALVALKRRLGRPVL